MRLPAHAPPHQYLFPYTDADNLYGCGKASDYQVQPVKYAERGELAEKFEQPEAMLKGERVRKATGGLKFSLVWADRNRLLAVGSNRFGQCGQNNLRVPEVKQLTPVSFQWERGEEVLDIASGFCHSLVLTNKYVYFFGSIEQGQNPFAGNPRPTQPSKRTSARPPSSPSATPSRSSRGSTGLP